MAWSYLCDCSPCSKLNCNCRWHFLRLPIMLCIDTERLARSWHYRNFLCSYQDITYTEVFAIHFLWHEYRLYQSLFWYLLIACTCYLCCWVTMYFFWSLLGWQGRGREFPNRLRHTPDICLVLYIAWGQSPPKGSSVAKTLRVK